MHHWTIHEVFVGLKYAEIWRISERFRTVHEDSNMVADADEQREGSFPVLDIPDSHLVPVTKEAVVEWLPDDELFFVSVPGLEGAWATGKTRQEALDSYVSVLREWISATVYFGDPLPPIPTIRLGHYAGR